MSRSSPDLTIIERRLSEQQSRLSKHPAHVVVHAYRSSKAAYRSSMLILRQSFCFARQLWSNQLCAGRASLRCGALATPEAKGRTQHSKHVPCEGDAVPAIVAQAGRALDVRYVMSPASHQQRADLLLDLLAGRFVCQLGRVLNRWLTAWLVGWFLGTAG